MAEEKVKKKNNKKTLVIIAIIAVVIVALAIAGIIAYLTDTESAENVFIMGKVDIELDEGGWNPVNGQDITSNAEIIKQPKIKNVGFNPAYVYLKVRVPKAQISKNSETKSPLFTYEINEGWSELEGKTVEDDDYIEKVYYYNLNDGKLGVREETPTLFDKVKLANITIRKQKTRIYKKIENI